MLERRMKKERERNGQGGFMKWFLFPAFVWTVVCLIFLRGSVPCFNECRVVPDFFMCELSALCCVVQGFIFLCWLRWRRSLVAFTPFGWNDIGSGYVVVRDERTGSHDGARQIWKIYVTRKYIYNR